MEAPLIEFPDGTITAPLGFLAGATDAGIRDGAPGRLDLALLVSEQPCSAAAVYTTTSLVGAAITVTRRHLANSRAQALIANSGCANAYTGEQGDRDAEEMCAIAGQKLGIDAGDVAVASTGVTGWLMPMDRVRTGVGRIIVAEDGGDHFAHAIMTTDTIAKQTAVQFQHGDVTYTVGGCAKGSGMIAPNMATMLAFLTTDAPVAADTLSTVLRDAVDISFNVLTIDGDTSPDDVVLVLANGAAGPTPAGRGDEIDDSHPALPLFRAAIEHVAVTLTRKLARDGEGASKLIEVRVDGAASLEDARRVARTVANSPLVKTAVYGNDPNWGRVIVAAGYSGAQLRESSLSLWIQDVEVFHEGTPVAYDAVALSEGLAHPEVRIRVDIGLGDASATAYGCDLTPEYVRINSEYTT